MKFKKIKYNGEKVMLLWTTSTVGQEVEHTLTSTQPPHPSFVNTLELFVDDVLDLLELDDEYRHGFRVIGLTLTTQDDGRRGLVVTCLKSLEGAQAPLV